MKEKRLYRSRSGRILWGVCRGLANYFNFDVTLIRVIFVVSIFLGLTGVIVYIILAALTPLEPN